MTMNTREADIHPLLLHASWLHRIANALLHDSDLAQDVVQTTFVQAWQNPPPKEVKTRPWLATVAINKARDLLRGESRRKAREVVAQATFPEAEDSPEELLGNREIHRAVVEVVMALSEPYRQTVILRYYEGLDASAIGLHMGIPEGTVRWRLKEGLDRIRKNLDARHESDRSRWMRALAPLSSPMANTITKITFRSPNTTPHVLSRMGRSRRWVRMTLAILAAGSLVSIVGSLVKKYSSIHGSGDTVPASMEMVTKTPTESYRRQQVNLAPPRLALTAKPSSDPQPLPPPPLIGTPDSIARHMLEAIATGSYEGFLTFADDTLKATLQRQSIDNLTLSLGARLESGFSLTALGALRREEGVEHLWKLEFSTDSDNYLVRLVILDEHAHSFRIQ